MTKPMRISSRSRKALERGTVLERAKCLHKEKKKYIKGGLSSQHGGDRIKNPTTGLMSFPEFVGLNLNISARSAYRYTHLYENLHKKARKIFRNTAMGDDLSGLIKVSRMSADQQLALAKMSFAHPDVKSLHDLLRKIEEGDTA